MAMRERFIETENGRIWCSVYGEHRKGIPLLVVHGGPGFISMPQTVSDLSAERPVYFYDQLGCGRSDRAKDSNLYSLNTYVDELSRVISELNLTEFVLVGFSWGCGLICEYMLRERPSGVKGLILSGPLLSSPIWEMDQRENIAKMPETLIEAIEESEMDHDYGERYQHAMIEYYKRFVCRMDPWPDYLQNAMEAMNNEIYLKMWGQSEFTVTGELKNFDLLPRLHDISIPVLLICGDSDEAGVKSVKDFQTSFGNANMAVIPDSSHMHHIEQPEIYKAAVNSFLKNLKNS
ncbi:MAG: proline iminopeptidase-family hydrolase [Candidatus Methanomethylophilaceae archaeon]|nr:proline iminopeptidase-family hydrolase [Candidatus Methanomethylophilaceae archaeon]